MERIHTLHNILLTGFRATGKSAVGTILARQLGYTFIDTDCLLTQRLGASIAEVVACHGWPYFRQAEDRLLRELPALMKTVVATGGGAIEHQDAWRHLRTCCFVVWLDARLDTISWRIAHDPLSTTQRPALTASASAQEEIVQLLERRRPLYAAGADLRLATDDVAPAVLAERIRAAVQGRMAV
jgi:shikimate kinase